MDITRLERFDDNIVISVYVGGVLRKLLHKYRQCNLSLVKDAIFEDVHKLWSNELLGKELVIVVAEGAVVPTFTSRSVWVWTFEVLLEEYMVALRRQKKEAKNLKQFVEFILANGGGGILEYA